MSSETINKIIGYSLLSLGLLLIIIPLCQSFNMLTGKSLPPEIFKSLKLEQSKDISPADIQSQVENAFAKIVPVDLIAKVLNVSAWMILVLVFIFGGQQISSIGIKLIKK